MVDSTCYKGGVVVYSKNQLIWWATLNNHVNIGYISAYVDRPEDNAIWESSKWSGINEARSKLAYANTQRYESYLVWSSAKHQVRVQWTGA